MSQPIPAEYKEGEVAYLVNHNSFGVSPIREVTITRVTKTRVTISDGRQYVLGRNSYVEGLTEYGGRSYRGDDLFHAGSKRLAETRERNDRLERKAKAKEAARKLLGSIEDVEALEPMLAELREYVAAVRRDRAKDAIAEARRQASRA